MNLKRREIKFQIPLSLVEPICDYLDAFCDLDYHSKIQPSGYYTINSLYLDTDRMYLLERKRRNIANRYSTRIRSYGENPDFPAYLEFKYKYDQLVHKQRAPITSQDTLRVFLEGGDISELPDFQKPFMRHAYSEIISLGLKPRMMTQYKRRAYMGRFDTYSRVTFDRSLRCYFEPRYEIFPREYRFLNYDHEDIYISQMSNIVLELKCEIKVPYWMSKLIQIFNLRHSQFSKFDSSWTFLTDEEHPQELFNLVNAR